MILGVKKDDTLKSLLAINSFEGQGVSFAITPTGDVVAPPVQSALYEQLDDIYYKHMDDSLKASFDQMEADVLEGKNGFFSFRNMNGQEVQLRYQPLEQMDWYIITLIPANVIGSGIDTLTMENLFLTAGAILLLFVFLVVSVLVQSRNQKKLRDLAFVDKVTGGRNNLKFEMDAQELIQDAPGEYSFVSMDVQDFKLINNIYGNRRGDEILCYLYRKITENLRKDEVCGRGGADIFYFILRNQNHDEIKQRLQVLYDDISTEESFGLILRFGVYCLLPEAEVLSDVREKANMARKVETIHVEYSCTFFNQQQQDILVKEKELIDMVDSALENGEFRVYLQPKVRLEDQKVAGAEALVRWKNPQKGFLSPGMFIPLFEKYRLISRLDLYVFEEVCRMLARWSQEGKELCTISVNLSRQNLEQIDFLTKYCEICSKYHVPPKLIEFELTETILFENFDVVRVCIRKMHEIGFHCSLDDFGTGYSSLGLLNALDVDEIKLDRSFFVGKNDNAKGRRIVETILKLAGQLHIRTVAEGIDQVRQVQYVKQSACDMVQGFVFFKPMPIETFEEQVFEQGRLRRVELSGQDIVETTSEESSISRYTGYAVENIIAFSYFTDEDEVVFSSLFSPVLGGEYTHFNAKAFFQNSGLFHENDRDDFFRMLERIQREDTRIENTLRVNVAEGRYEWVEVHLHKETQRNGRLGAIVGIFVNTGRWKKELNRWKEKANRDALTGIYNREFFEDWVKNAIETASIHCGALIFIDIDDFKQANDTLGHVFGDDILRCVAQRVTRVFRRTDIVARYGGDEFVVFVPSVSMEVLLARLEQLCEVFSNPYRSTNLRYPISGSIGAAYYPDGGEDYESLLKNADIALYEAKKRGKSQYVLYNPEVGQGEQQGEEEGGEEVR